MTCVFVAKHDSGAVRCILRIEFFYCHHCIRSVITPYVASFSTVWQTLSFQFFLDSFIDVIREAKIMRGLWNEWNYRETFRVDPSVICERALFFWEFLMIGEDIVFSSHMIFLVFLLVRTDQSIYKVTFKVYIMQYSLIADGRKHHKQ